jgi:hypothetical protein
VKSLAELMVTFWRAAVEAETRPAEVKPRLRVGKGRLHRARAEGRWWWEITVPGGDAIDRGTAPSWAEALAVGLAALEHATVAGSRS